MPFTNKRHQQFVGIAMLMFTTSSFARTTHTSIDDNDILEAVESELWFDDAIAPDGVDVQVRDGVVTLSGSAHTLLAKRRAVQLVGSLKGVRAIVDGVKVLPSGSTDELVLADVQAALADDPVADGEEIQVVVSLGLVTLKGMVDSFPEKRLTEIAVAGVRGVTEIDNQITILAKKARPDEEIRTEILRRFDLNPYLAEGLLDVQVRGGVVTLRGVVGSVNEQSTARLLCWVAGVKQVDASKLEVKWWLDRDVRRDKFTVLRNDVQLRRAVQDSFLYDPRLRGGKIEVRVRQASVSLLGNVASLQAKRAAEEDAENTLGVRRVINHLKVRPAEWPGDPAVTKRATAALQRDAHLADFDLSAKSHFGKVYLSGDVNTYFERNRAEVVVANVPGALDVVNRISVDSPWQAKTDEDIKEDTLRRLGFSPLLDSDQINVTVDDGVVTLTGHVYTPQERDAAVKHARQGGARRVVDRLRMHGGRTTPVGLKATLIPKQKSYEVPAGQIGKSFRGLLETAQRSRDLELLPPAPAVALTLHLENESDKPIELRLGHDRGGIDMTMSGDGAVHVDLRRQFVADFHTGYVVTIKPGGDLEIPVSSLQYGFRNASDRWYWTEPGQYTLQVELTCPATARGSFNEYSVSSNPVTLTVKAEETTGQ